jgi:hypothetical protein
MSARLIFGFLIAKQLFRDTPQVPSDAANRAAAISSLPMVTRSPVVPIVLAQEARNQIVENQNLQTTLGKKLDTDLYVANLDQALFEERITATQVRDVLREGLDRAQLQLIIDSARRNNKDRLLRALEVEPDSSNISAEVGRTISQFFEQMTRRVIEERREPIEERGREMTQSGQQQDIASTQSDENKKKA